MKVVTVTGYKSHELGIFDQKHPWVTYIKKALENKISQLVEEGLEWVIISGQLGVELWAGEVTISLKQTYPDLKLAILTPFLNQEDRWNEKTKAYYQEVYQQADFTESITKREYTSPAQLKLKNDYLIAKSDALVVLYDEEKQGSPSYYLTPAKKRQETEGYEIFFITPDDLEMIDQEEREANPDYWN
ncbi:DUF1273 domain-containing protein [Desertibacillus haloalkaliphilus]|uniref:DUF1273 domain-containing protein n=1 Tax=Desertibacillus haloalkaliphilus TaxID=1328930 RepID=UPI001C2574E4|nr:DUF1273 domain-containing protein [Desertibacillus haloalkaliphilus]MBU8906052.1 DUF1273 domain-containing protein [Desertibacillus haloalkaliphilus]